MRRQPYPRHRRLRNPQPVELGPANRGRHVNPGNSLCGRKRWRCRHLLRRISPLAPPLPPIRVRQKSHQMVLILVHPSPFFAFPGMLSAIICPKPQSFKQPFRAKRGLLSPHFERPKADP
jgi:hypothetical protein